MRHRIPFPLPSKIFPYVRQRIWPDPETDCWLWTGWKTKQGYGQYAFRHLGRYWTVMAHRAVWEMTHGSVPPELDHICEVRACVNPDHLRAMDHRENTLRGTSPAALHARQTHCVHGHEFTPENTYVTPSDGSRGCRTCRAADSRRRRRELRPRNAARSAGVPAP